MDEPAPGVEQVLRATASPTRAGDWSLVLASAGIDHRVVEGAGAFSVVVGAADATKILHGQWWRALTAVTLHENIGHLVGNVIASLVFVSAVGRWLGPGLGALLILACAWVANMLTALWHRHDGAFVSLGASTATFAAMGLVAGLQLWRRWRWDERRRYVWLPLGAGLALFAMTGTGATADFGAHFFGLGVGAAAGTIVAATGARPPGRVGQALLFAVVSAVLVGAWLLAFRASGLPLP